MIIVHLTNHETVTEIVSVSLTPDGNAYLLMNAGGYRIVPIATIDRIATV